METHCKDCRFYLPVDVFKGICKATKQSITPDDPFCSRGLRGARCKFCVHYTPEKEYLGHCKDEHLAYPDMHATNCKDFEWKYQN